MRFFLIMGDYGIWQEFDSLFWQSLSKHKEDFYLWPCSEKVGLFGQVRWGRGSSHLIILIVIVDQTEQSLLSSRITLLQAIQLEPWKGEIYYGNPEVLDLDNWS